MANTFSNTHWNLDTVNAGFVTTEAQYVRSIQWEGTGLFAGTDRVIITDPEDAPLFSARAKDAVVSEHFTINQWWHGGFKLPTLAGGTLIVTVG